MAFRYGALFDMDGVIVDSEEYHILAFEEWCREKNVPFDSADFRKHSFGKQNKDIFRELLGRELSFDEVQIEDACKEELFRKAYAGRVEPIKGLMGFIHDLKANGFGIAVATSGPPPNVEFTLKSIGAEKLFDAAVTSREITRGKPDPQVFLTAAEGLHVEPKRCVVFEDSTAGAKAAVASGAILIGLTTGHKQLEGAVRMIGDFTKITAEEVVRLIEDRCE